MFSGPVTPHVHALEAHTERSANPLAERLDAFVGLGAEERHAIAAITTVRKTINAHETIIREGSNSDRICLIMSGVAYRYRYLSNGKRQIFGYLLPGDLCDTQFAISNTCDHNVGVLCSSQIAIVAASDLMKVRAKFPAIERALSMIALVDAAILREWLLSVGQRDACQKLAHFFCELSERFKTGAYEARGGLSLPLTQVEIADTMGLTVVHVNRILQRFRREGLLCWSRRHFNILNYERLAQIAEFDGSYLRLEARLMPSPMLAYG